MREIYIPTIVGACTNDLFNRISIFLTSFDSLNPHLPTEFNGHPIVSQKSEKQLKKVKKCRNIDIFKLENMQ